MQLIKDPLNKRYVTLRDIFFLFIVSLIPLLWFKKGHFIAGGDIAAYIDLGNYLKFLPYAWDEQVMAGRHNFAVHFLFPYGIFWGFFKSLSVHLNIIEQIWSCATFFFSGISMYYLLSVIMPDSKTGTGKLLGSILYIINPFLANTPLLLQYNLAPVYMFTPLVLAFFMQGLNSRTLSQRTAFAALIGLSSLLFASSSLNITHLFAMAIILLVYFTFFLITNREKIKPAFAFIFICLLFYLLVNFWWISATFTKMVSMSATVSQSHKGWEVLKATSLYDAYRFIGSWAWRLGHKGTPYFPYSATYDKWPFVIIEFALILFVFSALWIRPKKSAFPALLAVAGLFLVKGATGPLGFLYRWVWENIPGFWIFREPFAKFMPINTLAFSILFAITMDSCFDRFKTYLINTVSKIKGKTRVWAEGIRNSSHLTFSFVVTFFLLILAFPMITGECIWDHYNFEMRSLHAKVPGYWYKASDWFKTHDPQARILPLPKTGYGKSSFNWESGFNAECSPVKNLFPNPLIYYEDFPHNRFQRYINNVFGLKEEDFVNGKASDIMRALGIDYIVHQKDVDWRFTWPDALSHDKLSDMIRLDDDIRYIKSFDKLDIYRIADPLPDIYPAEKVTLITGRKKDIFNIDKSELNKPPILFADSQFNGFDKDKLIGLYTPALSKEQFYPVKIIQKINPAKYVVSIDTDRPFWLIFNSTFSPEWDAYIDRSGIVSPAVRKRVFLDGLLNGHKWEKLADHYIINGYANGWRVAVPGDYNIVIQYSPQRKFEFSIYVSFISALLLIIYLISAKARYKSKT